MMQYLIDPLTKDIFNVKGRSSRKAYWMFFLLGSLSFGFIGGLVFFLLSFINTTIGLIFFNLIMIYLFIASFTMYVRRYHDLNLSFWLALIPFYNIYLAILVYFVRGTVGSNSYGEDPTDTPTGTTTPNPFSNNNQTPSSTPAPTNTL